MTLDDEMEEARAEYNDIGIDGQYQVWLIHHLDIHNGEDLIRHFEARTRYEEFLRER